MRWWLVLAWLALAAATLAPSEREALVDIYAALGGSSGGWRQSCGWLSGDPCCGNVGCVNGTWQGVTCSGGCNNNGTGGAVQSVVALNLANNGLFGELYEFAFSPLSSLAYLNMSQNLFLGNVSALFVSSLPSLTTLDLRDTSLDTTYPTIWAGLPNLTYLNLANTYLTGNISTATCDAPLLESLILESNALTGDPGFLSCLKELDYLDLSNNKFIAPIPESFGELTNLKTLLLGNNQFYGNISESWNNINLEVLNLFLNPVYSLNSALWSWPLRYLDISTTPVVGIMPATLPWQMEYLDIATSGISGTMPSFANNTALSYLDVSATFLTGTIPEDLCTTSLTNLRIGEMDLTGTIPACIGNLPLNSLDFSTTQLSGTIPEELCNLNSAWLFRVASSPYITGSIPECLGNLQSVTDLIMGFNSLTGTIPQSLGNLVNLNALDLSNNLLVGPLPADVAGMTNMSAFWVGGNRLNGSLPQGLTEWNQLKYFDISDNDFSGTLPQAWDLSDTPMSQFLAQGNEFDLEHGKLPFFFHINADCSMSGAASYIDLSDIPTQGLSTMDILLDFINNFQYLQTCLLPPNTIEVLDLSHMGLEFLDPLTLVFLSRAVMVDIHGNNLQGTLPSEYPVPRFLVALDLHNNQLEGPIPETFADAVSSSLVTLFLTGNPNLYSATMPSFLTADPEQMTVGPNYTCAGLTDVKYQHSLIVVDPSFLGYSTCRCVANFYGNIIDGCQLQSDLCSGCFAEAMPGAFNTLPPLNPGWYPSPSLTAATHFVPCRTDTAQETQFSCNSTKLVCTVNSNLTVNCQNNPCTNNFTGRKCSICAEGYYADANGDCSRCPGESEKYEPVYYLAIFLLVFFLVGLALLALAAVNRDTTSSVQRNSKTVAFRLFLLILVTITFVVMSNTSYEPEIWILLSMSMPVFVILFYASRRKEMVKEELPPFFQYSPIPLIMGAMKSHIVYMQTIESMGATVFLQRFTHFSPINSAVHFLACTLPDNGQAPLHMILFLGAPFIIAFDLIILCGIGALIILYRTGCCRGPTSQRKFYHSMRNVISRALAILFLLVNLFFYQVSEMLFSYFSCEPDLAPNQEADNATEYFNTSTPTQICFTHAWWNWGIAASILYGCYILTTLYVVVRLRSFHGRFQDTAVRTTYGFFYEPYQLKFWWYDGLVLVRRFLLNLFLVALPGNYQIFGVGGLLLVALVTQTTINPHRHRIVNVIETSALATATMVVFCILMEISNLFGGVNVTNPLFSLIIDIPLVITEAAVWGMAYAVVCTFSFGGRGLPDFALRAVNYFCCVNDATIDAENARLTRGGVGEAQPLLRELNPVARDVKDTGELNALLATMEGVEEERESAALVREAIAQPAGSREREGRLVALVKSLRRRHEGTAGSTTAINV